MLRLDRQPGGPLRQPVLVAPVHPAPAEEQVVEGNRGKVRKLIEEGRMKPAGLREVERAKAEGRWEQ